MIISGENLRLYYWSNIGRQFGGPCSLQEIEKEEYGYELLPGQTLYAIRYQSTNLECYFQCEIIDVSKDGLVISSLTPDRKETFIPWIKEFPIPAPKGQLTKCSLYLEPCDCLFEKNKLKDILSGNIDIETVSNGKIDMKIGSGIWHKHGGWRTISRYEANLQNFVKLGQMTLF